ncbi:MAG: AI-2E family transporter [Polymorphobacter sp.]
MTRSPTPLAPAQPLVDTMLRLGGVALLLWASYAIARPFIAVLTWAVILAVILYPLEKWLRARTGLGNAAAATIIGAVLTAALIVPLIIVVESAAESLIAVVVDLKAGVLSVPPPPPRLATLPLVGAKLSDAWTLVESNLPASIEKYRPFLAELVDWLGGFVGGMFTAVLSFIAALVFAAILMAYGEPAAQMARDSLARLMGSRAKGDATAALATATIRGVTNGVIGVAFVQALLVGGGFFVMGVPAAGLLALAVMFLGIVQVPAMIVALPVIIYVFATAPLTPAIIFTIWTIIAGLSDVVLKPMMLGRGLAVPMPVILVGVIGGLIAGGLVGLFIGPVVLGIAYGMFIEWVRPPAPSAA